MSLESPSFAPGSEIPRVHTCADRALSPPLTWTALPRDTRSLALIAEDLDTYDPRAPDHLFVYWVVYNIQPSETGLRLGAGAADLAAGTAVGLNSRGATGYIGPCPAPGTGKHRYAFRLYALDRMMPNGRAVTAAELRRRMDGHVLGIAELLGTHAPSP